MTPAETFRGKRVALFGLGGSGMATAAALKAGGAETLVWDDAEKAVAKAKEAGFEAVDLPKDIFVLINFFNGDST